MAEKVAEKSAEVAPVEPRRTRGERRLDEALRDVGLFVYASESVKVAATLYAAATHAAMAFPAFGRVLITSDKFESGKTTLLMTIAYLSCNPENVNGSKPALNSMLAQYDNSPEAGRPTLFLDECDGLFGKSGLSGSKDPVANILREGYKRNATAAWSVNRVAEKYSIYSPFLLAGNGTAVPQDVRSRAIVLKTSKGRPEKDLDSDGSEERLRDTGAALGAEVKQHIEEMRAFSYEGKVRGLDARAHQKWRPLLAVAYHLGGQRWLDKALKAFADLTNTGTVSAILSTDQQTLRDCAEMVRAIGLSDDDFIPSLDLAAELISLPRFRDRTALSVARDISLAMPMAPGQKHVKGGNPARGYFVRDLIASWEDENPDAVSQDIDPED